MAKRKKELPKGEFAQSEFKTKFDDLGRRTMICQNSVPGGKWWKGHLCDNWSLVGNYTTAVLCWRCTQQHCEAPAQRGSAVKSDKPKGWKFMKVFVTKDGVVYHKGEEQPDLKGTLPATVIEPKEPKKKLSKQEKDERSKQLGLEIKSLKAELFSETRKGKRAEITRALSKANRELKKVM